MENIDRVVPDVAAEKRQILVRTRAQDSDAVVAMWARTFKGNPINDPAIKMTQMLAACVAQGNFQVKPNLEKNWVAPNPKLSTADYLSHASRIMIDYAQLNEPMRSEFLALFSRELPGVVARSATHGVMRDKGAPRELKGLLIGVWGQMPEAVTEACDFGVNIAMGGAPNPNDGSAGHFYFHRNDKAQLLLCGLEQTAPPSSAWDVVMHNVKVDRYGQSHSLSGAADTYTAAGSVYFSDPVLIAKYLEDDLMPPEKYEGMLVTLTDQNWPAVKAYFDALIQSKNQEDTLRQRLSQAPSTAEASSALPKSYVLFDLKSYFNTIFKELLTDNQKSLWRDRHVALCALITKSNLTQSEIESTINSMLDDQAISPDYAVAIKRARTLFQREFARKDQLDQAALRQAYLEAAYQDMLAEIAELQSVLETLQRFYSHGKIKQSDVIQSFLSDSQALLDALTQRGPKLEESWHIVEPKESVTEELIRETQDLINEARALIQKAPELVAQQPETELLRLREENEQLRRQREQDHQAGEQRLQQRLQQRDEIIKRYGMNITRLVATESELREANQNLRAEVLRLGNQPAPVPVQVPVPAAADAELRAQVTQLTQTNADLRAELGRLRNQPAIAPVQIHVDVPVISPPQNYHQQIRRTRMITTILDAAEELERKGEKLNLVKFPTEKAQAQALVTTIDGHVNQFLKSNEPDQQALQTFTNSMTITLNGYKGSALEKHWEFKNVFATIVAAVFTLSISLWVNKAVNGNFLLLTPANKIGGVLNALKKVKEPAPPAESPSLIIN